METNLKARNALTLLVCAAFFTALFLLQPAVAKAQWTTPDASGNIYNTNSNNVGVGTTGPNYKFDITNALDRAQVRFGMGAGDSGGFLYSGGPSHAVFSAGAAYNSGWIAKSLSASMIEANLGQLTFYANQGISTGSPFTPTARMTVASSGNVGIGTTSPGERLVTFGNFLAGNLTTHTELYSGYGAQSNVIMELGYGTATANIVPLASLVLSKNLTSTNNPIGVISFANSNIADGLEKRLSTIGTSTDGALNSGVLAFNTMLTGTLAERMRITSAGRVGIGTSSPQDPLHVYNTANSVGTIRLQGGNNTAGFIGVWDSSPMLLLSNNRHPGTNNNFNTTTVGSMILVGAASAPGDIGFYTTSIGVTPTNTELLRMKATGQVGIGTITPGYRLDVQGGQINTSGGLCIAGDCKTAWSQVGGSQWTTSGTTINYSTGNVGIGVASPTTKLDVAGTVNATALTVSGSPVVSSQWATSGTTINYSTGNVGVATATPTEKLHVTGNVKVTGNIDIGGNINAKYQDVAEWVESSQELPAGTVVVLDSMKSNQVLASTQSYDSRVAGVISLKPGIALGEHGEGRVLVATTGRVKVKVDATNGPIQIGDLLVTSDKEGVAMKSVPVEIGGVRIHRPGTLIGKALEPLAQGTGEILVLLSLQ